MVRELGDDLFIAGRGDGVHCSLIVVCESVLGIRLTAERCVQLVVLVGHGTPDDDVSQRVGIDRGRLGLEVRQASREIVHRRGIEAGADAKNLEAGDTITATQSAVVLENLISQFLYSKAADGSDTPEKAPKK